jgi:hypothetical protein
MHLGGQEVLSVVRCIKEFHRGVNLAPVAGASYNRGILDVQEELNKIMASGAGLTRETFINAIESIRDLSLGLDINIAFSASDRIGTVHVGLNRDHIGQLVGKPFMAPAQRPGSRSL